MGDSPKNDTEILRASVKLSDSSIKLWLSTVSLSIQTLLYEIKFLKLYIS